MGPNVPGVGGYLLAWLVSCLAFSLGIAVWWATADGYGGLADLPLTTFVLGCYVVPISILFAVPGILFVHVVCREVRTQWVHVAVAGAAGAAEMLMVASWVTDTLTEGVPAILVLGASAALGRWVVVPLVRGRRKDAIADSASARPGC